MKIKLNYYLILNVPKTATEKEIRNSYLNLAKKYHPDTNKGNKIASQKFKQINQAYQVLKDPSKKLEFDKNLNDFESRQKKKRIQPTIISSSVPVTQLKKKSKWWKFFFRKKRKEKPIDLEIPFDISLQDFCHSRSKKIKYFQPYNGRKKKKSIKVVLPKGAKPGDRLQIKNQGGANGKKLYGDLFVKIQLHHHQFIEIKGSDIYLVLPLPFTQAFKGCTKRIPSPYGLISLNIPPQTKHNHILRVADFGLPLSQAKRGDFFVIIFQDYPQGLKLKIQNEMKKLSKEDKIKYIQQYESKNSEYEKVLDFEKSCKF